MLTATTRILKNWSFPEKCPYSKILPCFEADCDPQKPCLSLDIYPAKQKIHENSQSMKTHHRQIDIEVANLEQYEPVYVHIIFNWLHFQHLSYFIISFLALHFIADISPSAIPPFRKNRAQTIRSA